MRIQSNSCKDIRYFFENELNKLYSKEEACSLFLWAAEEILLKKRHFLLANNEYRVSESELLKLFNVVKRLAKAEPVQYIFEKAYFDDLILQVNPSVLIPRPETEELVCLIKKEERDRIKKKCYKIWDIGTGSGCIALSLAKSFKNYKVVGSDFSEEALVVANNNKSSNGGGKDILNVEFVRHDILQDTPLHGPWDIIVSNPPYVREAEKQFMQSNVLVYEPDTALFVDDSEPLLYYRAIAEIAKNELSEDGVLWFEINEYLGIETKSMLADIGFVSIEVINDFRGKNRFVRASR